jgi:hypothetical protein
MSTIGYSGLSTNITVQVLHLYKQMDLPTDIWREILSYSILPTTSLVSVYLYEVEMGLDSYRRSMMMEKYRGKIDNAVIADDWESVSFMYHYKDQGFIHTTDRVDVIQKVIDSGRIDLAIDMSGGISMPDHIQAIKTMRMDVTMKYVVTENVPVIRELIDKSYLDSSIALVLTLTTDSFNMAKFIFDRYLLHIIRDTLSTPDVINDNLHNFIYRIVFVSVAGDITHLLKHIYGLHKQAFTKIYNDRIRNVINEQTHPNICKWVRLTF